MYTDAEKCLSDTKVISTKAVTCIDFVERTSETMYVRMTNTNNGCYSYVGKIRNSGSQQLNLADNCVVGLQ